jgi:hypothetical protein
MRDEPTCGKGLAENASLPAKIRELIDALAENLDLHLTALDLRDENSKKEDDVYRKLPSLLRKSNIINLTIASFR